jgi:beta-exotoxin I transport system permease protein
MKGPWFLLKYSLRRARTLVLATGLLLACFQWILIVVARSIERSNAFGELAALIPPFARELLGPSLLSTLSFQGIVCVGYFHLAVLAALVALSVGLATMPTSEIETGFMDLMLSRPLARHWMVTRSIVVVTLGAVVVLLMMTTATWAGLNALAPRDIVWPAPHLIRSLAVNLGLLMLCWGGVAMAIGSGSRRRGVAGALAGWIALAAFLLDYVGRAWQPAESVAWLSPFRYYNPFELLSGDPLPAKNLLVLAGVAVGGFVVSYVLFARRDITH